MASHKVKAFVLLSGGIDSTTVLSIAMKDFPDAEIECVSVDYGQRHIKEIDAAKAVIDYHNSLRRHHRWITHSTLPLAGLLSGMLVNKGDNNEQIPNAEYADLPEGISPTYVSFRNGTMLSLLAARAQSWIMEQEASHKSIYAHHDTKFGAILYCGVHADDAARDAYPDCTLEFIGAMANAIQVGTYGKVRLRAPLIHMDKSDVVALGTRLEAPLQRTWSCYAGGNVHCGTCPTCRARKKAFQDAHLGDPTVYEINE